MITKEQAGFYKREGYLTIPGFFSPEEINKISLNFKSIGDGPEIPGSWEPDRSSDDPLKRYPRVMMPHRYNALSRRVMLDRRLFGAVSALTGEEAVAIQSMFYYKPPGGRGQAPHQDNFYLRVKPGTCFAAWIALDECSVENGCLHLVPDTDGMEVVCPDMADEKESFTVQHVHPPAGKEAVPMNLKPGDVLFFNGNTIHGSFPNKSEDSWRRSFICHYMPKSSTHISGVFLLAIDREGNELAYQNSAGDYEGPCGEPFPAFWKDLSEEQRRKFSVKTA